METSARIANGKRFLEGLSAGALGSLAGGASLLYLLSRGELISFGNGALPPPAAWLTWLYDNLGSSLPVFALLLLAFFVTLNRLAQALASSAPVERILQLDHLADTWTTLFFGTGVIWTAIGMRSALIVALGGPEARTGADAFSMLERLVDGGILLALSTTILGGVGGYLMRVYKSLSLGAALQRRYDDAARVDTSSMRDALHRIEAHLNKTPKPDADDTR